MWAANNLPLTYAIAAVPSAATRALGLPGGPLLGLRLVNVAAAAGAVAMTFALARRLSGGDPMVGLVAAGLLATSPHLGFIVSLAFNDGMAPLAMTGVISAVVDLAAGTADRHAARALGLWCALAAAVRPMALVAAGIGLALCWWRRQDSPLVALGWIATPAAVTSGWFYALSIRRYGDPTASDALFAKFLRQPAGSLGESLTQARI